MFFFLSCSLYLGINFSLISISPSLAQGFIIFHQVYFNNFLIWFLSPSSHPSFWISGEGESVGGGSLVLSSGNKDYMSAPQEQRGQPPVLILGLKPLHHLL